MANGKIGPPQRTVRCETLWLVVVPEETARLAQVDGGACLLRQLRPATIHVAGHSPVQQFRFSSPSPDLAGSRRRACCPDQVARSATGYDWGSR
jgi:hypothetical protein